MERFNKFMDQVEQIFGRCMDLIDRVGMRLLILVIFVIDVWRYFLVHLHGS